VTLSQGLIQKIGPYQRDPKGVEDIGECGEEDPVVEVPDEADGPR